VVEQSSCTYLLHPVTLCPLYIDGDGYITVSCISNFEEKKLPGVIFSCSSSDFLSNLLVPLFLISGFGLLAQFPEATAGFVA